MRQEFPGRMEGYFALLPADARISSQFWWQPAVFSRPLANKKAPDEPVGLNSEACSISRSELVLYAFTRLCSGPAIF
jgi:hypothetical protein